jgi:putative ABC transport system permease protein
MALGAQRRDVRSLIASQALGLGAIGMGIGAAAALASTRVLHSLLFEVGAGDPATFGGVFAALTGVVCAAAYFPARRATRVDPMTALRTD